MNRGYLCGRDLPGLKTSWNHCMEAPPIGLDPALANNYEKVHTPCVPATTDLGLRSEFTTLICGSKWAFPVVDILDEPWIPVRQGPRGFENQLEPLHGGPANQAVPQLQVSP